MQELSELEIDGVVNIHHIALDYNSLAGFIHYDPTLDQGFASYCVADAVAIVVRWDGLPKTIARPSRQIEPDPTLIINGKSLLWCEVTWHAADGANCGILAL